MDSATADSSGRLVTAAAGQLRVAAQLGSPSADPKTAAGPVMPTIARLKLPSIQHHRALQPGCAANGDLLPKPPTASAALLPLLEPTAAAAAAADRMLSPAPLFGVPDTCPPAAQELAQCNINQSTAAPAPPSAPAPASIVDNTGSAAAATSNASGQQGVVTAVIQPAAESSPALQGSAACTEDAGYMLTSAYSSSLDQGMHPKHKRLDTTSRRGSISSNSYINGAAGGAFSGTTTATCTETLRVHVITFNMAGTVPATVTPKLFCGEDGAAPDIIVVGTQESCTLSDWERLLTEQLGTTYQKVAQDSLLYIAIFVYARKQVAHLIKDVRTSTIACGVANVLGNKGGVAVSCSVAGVRLLLVTCHLAAHDEYVERRNADFQRIASGLFGAAAVPDDLRFQSSPSVSSGSSTPAGSPGPSTPAPGSPLRGSTLARTSGFAAAPASPSDAIRTMSRLATSSSMPTPVKERSGSPICCGGSAINVVHPVPLGAAAQPSLPSSLPPVFSPFRQVTFASPSQSPLSMVSIAQNDLTRARSYPSLQSAGMRMGSVMRFHDVVLWCGDLNYRINGTIPMIKHLLDRNMHEVLHANDQLRAQIRKGQTFQDFDEQPIHFPPTFKVVPGSTKYSHKRIPSWTDRVLHATYAPEEHCSLRPLYYRRVEDQLSSDHLPVVAGYELQIMDCGLGSAKPSVVT